MPTKEVKAMDKTTYHQIQSTFNIEFNTSVHQSYTQMAHFHKNFEIIFGIKGSCICFVSGQKYTIHEGEAIFICPFQVHKFDVDADSSIRTVTFHEHLILTLAQSMDGCIPATPLFHTNKDITDFFLQLLSKLFGADSGSIKRITPYQNRLRIKGILYLISADLLDTTELIPMNKTDSVVLEIVKYISLNFKENISLQMIAKDKGYNYQYLSRVFNRCMGTSFKKLLNQYRAQCAFQLIQDTNLPMSQICFECGFQSIRSFNQICHDVFDQTPRNLRLGRHFSSKSQIIPYADKS